MRSIPFLILAVESFVKVYLFDGNRFNMLRISVILISLVFRSRVHGVNFRGSFRVSEILMKLYIHYERLDVTAIVNITGKTIHNVIEVFLNFVPINSVNQAAIIEFGAKGIKIDISAIRVEREGYVQQG
jgi:hypothetical protein